MSQFPTPPPPPPPGGYPPGGFPPQGYAPAGPGSPFGAAPPRGSNVPAVLSLILGILGCIPLAAPLAVILGVIGIGKSASARKGKGMAIAGLLLGLVFTAIYVGGFYGYQTYIKPLTQTATGFVQKLAQADVSGARAYTTSAVSDKDLQQASDTIRTLGELKDLQLKPGQPMTLDDMRLSGQAIFEKGTRQVNVRITKQADGAYKITEFTIQ